MNEMIIILVIIVLVLWNAFLTYKVIGSGSSQQVVDLSKQLISLNDRMDHLTSSDPMYNQLISFLSAQFLPIAGTDSKGKLPKAITDKLDALTKQISAIAGTANPEQLSQFLQQMTSINNYLGTTDQAIPLQEQLLLMPTTGQMNDAIKAAVQTFSSNIVPSSQSLPVGTYMHFNNSPAKDKGPATRKFGSQTGVLCNGQDITAYPDLMAALSGSKTAPNAEGFLYSCGVGWANDMNTGWNASIFADNTKQPNSSGNPGPRFVVSTYIIATK